jgi:spermidine synthase
VAGLECAGEAGVATVVLERAAGVTGELVLRRTAGGLEVISNGTFLISAANEASSRALVTAALPFLPTRSLSVLIGGLGLGYALEAALDEPRVASVVVAEIEPTIVAWFGRHAPERAARVADDARARIVVADVAELLQAGSAGYDLVALDTDNGPEWLVREANAGLYSEAGGRLAHDALRAGGATVFWSPARYERFEELLGAVFASVHPVPVSDIVGGRPLEYTMYVCLRGANADC